MRLKKCKYQIQYTITLKLICMKTRRIFIETTHENIGCCGSVPKETTPVENSCCGSTQGQEETLEISACC